MGTCQLEGNKLNILCSSLVGGEPAKQPEWNPKHENEKLSSIIIVFRPFAPAGSRPNHSFTSHPTTFHYSRSLRPPNRKTRQKLNRFPDARTFFYVWRFGFFGRRRRQEPARVKRIHDITLNNFPFSACCRPQNLSFSQSAVRV
jgi:hypothetical protein